MHLVTEFLKFDIIHLIFSETEFLVYKILFI